jgi:acyl transferase domain-containing protein/NADPH:quinone reductase-like Zn-dependent oxidoreductase/NADP-dependent 3-hydroxy acid dehydrogenase YdfG/acyl carrier protein
MPGGDGLEAFADLLLSGRTAIGELPENRWTKPRYFHPQPGQAGKTYSFAAGFLPEVYAFDAAFFGISPREAHSIDPQQRLMLELAYEAIEDAGLLPARLAGSPTGVYVGASSWDFAATSFADAAALDAYAMQGAALSSVSNRVSYVFALRGPSLTVDTACSSSLVALHLACEALHRGEIGQAIVGGVNLLLAPQSYVGFSRASMLSRQGRCHAFDARADGYVRAEGGGALVLKPLAQALQDGDDIRAVIHATGMNSDGKTSGFSLPSGEAQAALLRQVYTRADIAPDQLSYFEAHGTGTPVGDPIEAGAIGAALGRHRQTRLPIGSVKTNVGHLEPASGMAGIMKLIVAFEHRVIPPSLHFVTPNPHIPFDELNIEVVAAARALPRTPHDVLAGINSFGFGGTNAHAILAAPPVYTAPRAQDAVPRPEAAGLPLLLSARCTGALRALAAEWRDTLTELSPAQVPALLRGAARRREHYPHRLAVAAASPAELVERLDGWLRHDRQVGVAAGQSTGGTLAFVFSGNGSQWPGMARDALALSPGFAAALAEVDALLAPELGWSVTARLSADSLADDLRDTSVAQPLLFAVQVASVTCLRTLGVRAHAHVGHSAGEVAAAWASGALTLAQACHVIIQRSVLQRATHGIGRMAALNLDAASAQSLIERVDPRLVIAAVNSRQAVTIAGPEEAIGALQAVASAAGNSCQRLDLDYAFHSAAMDPIEAPLLQGLAGLQSAAPETTLVSTVTAEQVAAAELGAEYWWHNVRQPVRFQDAVDRLIGQGVRIFLEIGPQPVLASYLRDALQRTGLAGRVLTTLSRRPAPADPFTAAAAACHVAGGSLGDAACFDGAATVRGLPRYPWQRQHFGTGRTTEAVEVTTPVHDHPLLGFRDPQSRDSWMSHLSTAGEPWLADHVLDGSVVLPAAAMIEMALAAARVRHEDATSLELQDLEISRPLVLEHATIRDCRTTVAPDGQWQIASRPRLATEAPQPHATGRIMAGFGTGAVLPALDRDGAVVIDGAAVYRTAEALHLHYGPAFRTVTRVYRIDPHHAVAELAPQDSGRSAGFQLDPTLVDGALQALLVLAADQPHLASRGAVVPWRFGRVRLLRPDGAQPRWAALHVRQVGPRSICADIALLDATQVVVAELIDCWFVAMAASVHAPAAQTFWTSYVPSARQPLLSIADPAARAMAAVAGTDDRPVSVLLADACATAAAFEALRPLADPASGLLPAAMVGSGLPETALGWLAEEGYAEAVAQGWRLAAASDLPPADEIWRSLFFENPSCPAECAVLAALGPAVAGAGVPGPASSSAGAGGMQLSAMLRDHLLFASRSAASAMDAMLQAIVAVTATWPEGSCLRVAAAGALHGPFLRRVLDRMEACGIPVRLVVVVDDAGALAAAQDMVSPIPGGTARLWDSIADDEPHGFDLVLDLYGLSLPGHPHVTPEALAGLLAPGGLLLGAEPGDSRVAHLVFGPGLDPATTAMLRPPQDWCASLDQAGCTATQSTWLEGAIWPVALLVATMGASGSHGEAPARVDSNMAGLVVFAAPDDPLAAALAARQGVLRLLPIEAMKEALTAPFASRLRHVLLLAGDPLDGDAGAEALVELLADISAALVHMPPGQQARLWLVSSGSPLNSSASAALAGLRRVAANEIAGIDCRAIGLDPRLPVAAAAERLLQEFAAPDTEPEVYWRTCGRLVPRLRHGLPRPAAGNGPRRLDVLRPGLINSLAWVASRPAAPGAGEVAIEVRAAALNFRDVMWAQGLLPDEAVLQGFSGPSLGLECAGVVTAVGEGVDDLRPGDRVIAVAPAALATHVVTRRNGVMALPDGLDFAAAATVPVAFMTAVYALGHLARLQAGETVLIHGGAGGVGLAAIQYALHKGATVYATAGSALRRQTLRMLGVTAVFDSRSPSFADDLLAMTGGSGVDVVLNSLSAEAMQQSVRLLRPFGRFLEIGKRDLYRNTPIGIRPLRHNASYFAIDVDELVACRPALGQSVLDEIAGLLADGRLQPLPYRAFGFSEAVHAFRLLQSSGHLGKVVLLPEPTPVAPDRPSFTATSDGVYLVTGGLAGFGLETARWLARNGARKLALLGRRGAATPGADAALAEFAADGVTARAFACDVADPSQLQAALTEIRRTMGPLHGVLHAAMVLDDGYLQDLDTARFAAVIRPKLAGAMALDRLTRDDPLDLFILFSSVTTVIGTPGQANYVAANAALEALAARRQAAGLPALAVQWGPIADAGYLVRDTRVSAMLAKLLGSSHLRAADALDALPGLLQSGCAVAGVADVAWGELRARMAGLAGPFWSEMPAAERRTADSDSIQARLAELPADEAHRMLLDILVAELARILQQSAGAIDVNRPIQEFGVDSLMAVELQTALEGRLGQQLPLMSLTGAATLRAIPPRLLQAMRSGQGAQADDLAAAILRHENAVVPPPGVPADAPPAGAR